MFLGKKFLKLLKKSELNINHYMAVVFEAPQKIVDGQLMTWTLDGVALNVFVIEEKQLFVKGKNVWAYAVGIIEQR